ncbi:MULTISPECIES: sel1 repeat family protein [Pseudoalteromonas]|uniref:Sel1 repeat family protein n=1 Tax=Pseudoalteromonas obscura TaxID=3048491 RepID=A0ABT7ERM5_9GAMM|nr:MULTISPECIES: sel1 repeat family protein [Pseudoalteromonas]MBQ4838921.1 sel1 repeat family protein [Pseudoalteromonas luteoviolacea]MDK2597658.1 sel1 repeat family protein [Pseudoalteromonas sp. P94(2023)]
MIKHAIFRSHDIISELLSRYKAIVIAFIIIAFCAHWIAKHQRTQQLQYTWLEAPKVDDVIMVDIGKMQTDRVYQAQYRIAQVIAVNDSQLTLKQGRYTYARKRDARRAIQLDNLMVDDYFQAAPWHIPRSQVMPYYQSGAIYAAYRPNDIYVLGGIVKQRALPHFPKHQRAALSAENSQGIGLYQRGELVAAREAFELAAKSKDQWGMYNLATMLIAAEGGEQNLQRGFELLKSASAQGNVKAKEALTSLCTLHQICE